MSFSSSFFLVLVGLHIIRATNFTLVVLRCLRRSCCKFASPLLVCSIRCSGIIHGIRICDFEEERPVYIFTLIWWPSFNNILAFLLKSNLCKKKTEQVVKCCDVLCFLFLTYELVLMYHLSFALFVYNRDCLRNFVIAFSTQ